MPGSKYQRFIDDVSFVKRGFADWNGCPLAIDRKDSLDDIRKTIEPIIKKHNLTRIDDAKKAKIMCLIFAQYPDNEGYNVKGCYCYEAKLFKGIPNIMEISYNGFCGDVNKIHLSETNSIKIYLK